MFTNFALIILNNIRLLSIIFWILNILLMLYNSYDLCVVHVHFDSDSDSITSQGWEGRSVEIMDDNRSIHELDGRSLYELEGNSQNTDQRTYTAYDVNYVQTSQGWRTELPTGHFTRHYDHHLGSDRLHRVSNPSYYPPSSKRDSYPLGEISSRGTRNSTLLGEIEKSRSDLMQ